MTRLLVVLGLGGGALPAVANAPQMAVSFGFEPRLGSAPGLDAQLADYGFGAVGSPVLPAWGLRGRAFLPNGVFGALGMSYGVRTGPGALSTTTTLTETTAGVGYRMASGLFGSLDVGFAVLTHAVASLQGGGALLYPGPVIHPRVGWAWQFTAPFGWFLAVSAGANLHAPMGTAHRNPLWEASFARPLVTTFTLSVESGLGVGEVSR